jgi:hypothetical protein
MGYRRGGKRIDPLTFFFTILLHQRKKRGVAFIFAEGVPVKL